MSWVAGLKKEVKQYFANRKKAKQNEQRVAETRKKLPAQKPAPASDGNGAAIARANSLGMTRVNAQQYAVLSAGDQAEIDRMLRKKKPNAGKE